MSFTPRQKSQILKLYTLHLKIDFRIMWIRRWLWKRIMWWGWNVLRFYKFKRKESQKQLRRWIGWKGTRVSGVPGILHHRTRLPPLLPVDDPLVLFQLVVAHAVEGILGVRRLEHRRVVLEVPLDDALAGRPDLKEKYLKPNKSADRKTFFQASVLLLFKHFPSP